MIGRGKYTFPLNSILMNPTYNRILNDALKRYPIYKGEIESPLLPTREELNEKILNHYRFHEICYDDVDRFIYEFSITMIEIMPYYNELFKSIEIMLGIKDPFGNVNITETYSEERNDSSTGENSSNVNMRGENEQNIESTGKSNNVKEIRFQDTPQNIVDDLDKYLTNYTKENESNTNDGKSKTTDKSNGVTSTTATGKTNNTGTTKHTLHKEGNHGVNTYAHDMIEYRESLIDIVDRIIHDKRLAELFMLVW